MSNPQIQTSISKKIYSILISISDKMFITKEVNSATVSYFKKIVLRKLLMEFSFGPESNNRTITDLFESVNYYGFDLLYEIELTLFEMLWRFEKNLEKEERTAFYFWGLNQKYLHYLEDFEYDDDTYSDKEFDEEFGRSLAYKIYEPNISGLEGETIEGLTVLLCNFAGEFDLLLVDETTIEDIMEVMDIYCSSLNHTVSVI